MLRLRRFVQAGIDAVDISSVREFWRAVLRYQPAPDSRITDLDDPRRLNPVVFFQRMDATDAERRRQRNRIHVELLMPAEELQARVDVAVAAGGQMRWCCAPLSRHDLIGLVAFVEPG